jgi:hypothetical protein
VDVLRRRGSPRAPDYQRNGAFNEWRQQPEAVMKLTFIVLCWTLFFVGAVFVMGYFLQPNSEPAGRGDRPWIP